MPTQSLSDLVRRTTLCTIAVSALLAAVPAKAQLAAETYDAFEDVVRVYSIELTAAAPCIYAAGFAFYPGEDVFPDSWAEGAVADALAEFDDLSAEQYDGLLKTFRANFSPDFAVPDIRDLARSCYVAGDDSSSIVRQLQMFTGVGVPISIRLERIDID